MNRPHSNLFLAVSFSLAVLPLPATDLFFDDFESYPVDATLPTNSNWVQATNNQVTPRDESTGVPFGTPNQFLEYNDSTISNSGGFRSKIIAAASDALTTLSLDFLEPDVSDRNDVVKIGYSIDGKDMLSANTRVFVTLDDGVIGGTTGGTSTSYSYATAYRLFMIFNDTASAVSYQGGSIDSGTAHVWFQDLTTNALTFAGVVNDNQPATPETSYAVAFRANSGAHRQWVNVDNIALATGVVLPAPSAGPMISVAANVPFEIDFGVQALSVPFLNSGSGDPLVVSSVTPGGTDSAYFTVDSFTSPLTAGGNGSITLTFNPSDGLRNYQATLAIASNDPTTPLVEVDLSVDVFAQSLGRILFVGDSITEGRSGLSPVENGYSWRYFAWKRMIDWNIGHQFTGTRTSNKDGTVAYSSYNGNSFTNRHEAIWGSNANERESNLDTALNTMAGVNGSGVPDTVVMFVGGNGVSTGSTVDPVQIADITADISSMIDMVQGEINGVPGNPNINIRIVSILPRFPSAGPDARNLNGFTALNTQLATLPTAQTTATSTVRYIDAYEAMNDPSHYYDGTHPNLAGADRLAGIIFGSLIPDRDNDDLPDAWESSHFPNLDATDGELDSDGDGMSDREEFAYGSDPTVRGLQPPPVISVPDSLLSITLPAAAGPGYEGLIRRYQIFSSADLIDWDPEDSGIATGAAIEFPVNLSFDKRFYRVSVSVAPQ